jgi:N-methylhydantoinase A/oxoprolinase/acetone carboxylase beta subunit
MSDRVYRLGCDIGGTFTDFVLLNDETECIDWAVILEGPLPTLFS